jgi:hypothetical protein
LHVLSLGELHRNGKKNVYHSAIYLPNI